jgi:AcrR family transcriptional regulator
MSRSASKSVRSADLASRRGRRSRSRLYGLPREVVVREQRRRILGSVCKTTADQGYQQSSVVQFVRLAGVSRRTFYELFADKEEAFLAAHEEVLAHLTARIAAVAGSERSWPLAVAAGISTALEVAATDTDRALLLIGEPLTGGPRAAYSHDLVVARFAPALRLGRSTSAVGLPPTLEEALLGGILGVVGARLRARRSAELLSMAPSLAEFALTPYIGVTEARRVVGDSLPSASRAASR